ncbi:acyl-CoA dehydrogenase family protein [Nocardioides sp. WS12]|uniref:acyl-CoA dehydrogenase family protein n=1 Tax=Nocardioides sp. WS12 TaxID=2486272 RepID=UPI0015FCB29A|nr:acyl-CoA dehydrogenase family protein [Nocardioides sp. WS12]
MELVRRPGYDADHDDFTQSVRRFLSDHLVGELDAWRTAGRFASTLFPAAGERGFLATTVPEDLGGAGIEDPRFAAILVEEIAATGAAGLALVTARHVGVVLPALTPLAAAHGRIATLVQGLASGEMLGCVVALGPDLRAAGVPGAGVAEVFLVVDPARPEVFLVLERDAVDVVDARLLAGNESAVADVVVAADALDGDGHPAAGLRTALDLWSGVVSVAAARAAFDLTVDYVQERAVFGRKLATFENTRFRLAELGAELTAARGLVDEAVGGLALGGPTPALAAAARIVAGSVHDRTVDQGMQLHGGYGYMREYPISHAFGDARFLRVVADATSEPRQLLASALDL